MRPFLFLIVLLAGCSTAEEPFGWPQTVPPPPRSTPIPAPIPADNPLLALHNRERELKGRPGFAHDPYLTDYAQKHAQWMAGRNSLKHSDISVLMGRYYTAGENIAWNQRTPEEAVRDWMGSSGHRANILNRNFNKVGFGVAKNARGEPYWCAVFGS